MTQEELDKDMIASIEMWLHENEPMWVEKELVWLEELRTRLIKEDVPNGLEEPVCGTCKWFDDGRSHCWERNGELQQQTVTTNTPACEKWEEPASDELEAEIQNMLEQYAKFTDGRLVMMKPSGLEKIARYFAKWGKEQGYREGFLEGAKTQREEDNRLVDIIYQQGIEKGKDDMKEQAVSGTLAYEPHLRRIIVNLDDIPDGAWNGSETPVEVIIFKKEQVTKED